MIDAPGTPRPSTRREDCTVEDSAARLGLRPTEPALGRALAAGGQSLLAGTGRPRWRPT